MKKILFSLIILFALFSCKDETVNLDNSIALNPSNSITAEQASKIISTTTIVDINSNKMPFEVRSNTINLPTSLTVNANGEFTFDTEIYLANDTDTIAYVTIEDIKEAERLIKEAINKLDYKSANAILKNSLKYQSYN